MKFILYFTLGKGIPEGVNSHLLSRGVIQLKKVETLLSLSQNIYSMYVYLLRWNWKSNQLCQQWCRFSFEKMIKLTTHSLGNHNINSVFVYLILVNLWIVQYSRKPWNCLFTLPIWTWLISNLPERVKVGSVSKLYDTL